MFIIKSDNRSKFRSIRKNSGDVVSLLQNNLRDRSLLHDFMVHVLLVRTAKKIHHPFHEKMSLRISNKRRPKFTQMHPNYQLLVLLVNWFDNEALGMFPENIVTPDQASRKRKLIWNYTGRTCDKGPFLIN